MGLLYPLPIYKNKLTNNYKDKYMNRNSYNVLQIAVNWGLINLDTLGTMLNYLSVMALA
jgi:hypothetical protein